MLCHMCFTFDASYGPPRFPIMPSDMSLVVLKVEILGRLVSTPLMRIRSPTLRGKNWRFLVGKLPSPWEIPCFLVKWHQNGGFSMATKSFQECIFGSEFCGRIRRVNTNIINRCLFKQ